MDSSKPLGDPKKNRDLRKRPKSQNMKVRIRVPKHPSACKISSKKTGRVILEESSKKTGRVVLEESCKICMDSNDGEK